MAIASPIPRLAPVTTTVEERVSVREMELSAWSDVLVPQGVLVQSFGKGRAGEFGPLGLAISQEELFVGDIANDCISVHGLYGTFLRHIGARGSGDGKFIHPGNEMDAINNQVPQPFDNPSDNGGGH